MRILLAIDGSKHSAEAVKTVARRPWPSSSVIRVLNAFVVPMSPPAPVGDLGWTSSDIEVLRGENKKASEKLVLRVANSLGKGKIKVERVVREGDPATVIVEEAKEWRADLIVVGSHGYTGLKRLVLGSVAQSVVAHAPCSVEVVRRKESGRAAKAAGGQVPARKTE